MTPTVTGPAPAVPAAVLAALPDVDPGWSRTLEVADADGVAHRWHVLDTHAPGRAPAEPVRATLLCVHGNPTWSFLWRRFLAAAPAGWRVVAVDQLGMGYSERTAEPRRFATRVADLGALTSALGVDGPVVTLAHDWGGPISLGWAQAHRDQLAGVVLTNTGVDLPVGDGLPALIRLARNPGLRQLACTTTPVFVRGGALLSRPGLPAEAVHGLVVPYDHPGRRRAVADFVADVPLEADHPSRPAWDAMADGVRSLADVPVLLAWGPRDPVFGERYLEDLLERLPQADVQRYPRASHLVTEDAPQSAVDVWRWVQERVAPTLAGAAPVEPAPPRPPLTPEDLPWAALLRRADDEATAVAEIHDGVTSRTSFAALNQRIRDVAAGLAASGVRPGERVALLVPPGLELTVAVYACWRVGAAIVVADAGL
ncbi:MAG: Haloalkane dehalogenase-like protein / AMP-dependent synthetase/ligase in alkane synthesis cluster, partial [uncultured Friedmanniella sp.]